MEQGRGFLMDELTWAQRVKTVRLKLGITQDQLAERLEVDRVSIARWEALISRPYSAEAERFTELELELETKEPS